MIHAPTQSNFGCTLAEEAVHVKDLQVCCVLGLSLLLLAM